MGDPYTFEFEGHVICYYSSTVRSQLKRQRYLASLIVFYGYDSGEEAREKDPEEWENFKEYSDGMSQCTTDAPWWVNPMSTPEQVGAAYELFLSQPAILFHKFVTANYTVMTPKKTEMTSQET